MKILLIVVIAIILFVSQKAEEMKIQKIAEIKQQKIEKKNCRFEYIKTTECKKL